MPLPCPHSGTKHKNGPKNKTKIARVGAQEMSKTLPPVRVMAPGGLPGALASTSILSTTSNTTTSTSTTATRKKKAKAGAAPAPPALPVPAPVRPPAYSMRSSTESLGAQAAFQRQLADLRAAQSAGLTAPLLPTRTKVGTSLEQYSAGAGGVTVTMLPGAIPDERPGSTGTAATLPSVSWGSDDGR